MSKSTTHGGSRPGSGRPRGEGSRVTSIRIPLSLWAELAEAVEAGPCPSLNALILRLLRREVSRVKVAAASRGDS